MNATRLMRKFGTGRGSIPRTWFVLLWLLFSTGVSAQAQDLSVAPPEQAQTEQASRHDVCLTIDFGDNSQMRFVAIPWHEGMTVLDVMQHLKSHPRGVNFRYRGEQQTAFLEEIAGLANEGGDGRNWMFKVSGKLAKQSFALTSLKEGDDVLWEFR